VSFPVHAFTVDLEDWFQGIELDRGRWSEFDSRLAVGTDRLLRLLADAGVRATFFVLGAAAEVVPDLVKRICAEGHEIGTHGYGHDFVYRLEPKVFQQDIERSMELLERLTGASILGYRAPYFSIVRGAEWALEVLRACGIRYDSSIFPVHNYRYGIPDAPRWAHEVIPGLVELPPSTWRLGGRNVPVAGGAYFRLFPYTLSQFGLRRVAAEGQPVVFYLHPWELDPEQPRIPLPRRVAVPHYANLRRTAPRLRRLLADFRFSTAADVLAARGWSLAATGSPETG
jgi:polysaccharide deacetylase family protein (PEP-CTERM system associated)